MSLRVLDPTNESHRAGGAPAPRPTSLTGATVGIISNGKVGTRRFFTALQRGLRDELGVAQVVWRTKANYSAPAEAAIVDEIKKWQAVVTGVGD